MGNIRELLIQTGNYGCVSIYGLFRTPGAGAVVCVDGYKSAPVILKKSMSPMGNNYTVALVGIQMTIEFLTEP